MNYLSVENLTYHWGDIRLFNDLNFGINEGQKVALVARNGTGKTTLLRILLGKMQADTGRIVYNDSIKVGMLEQNPYFEGDKTVIQQVLGIPSPTTEVIAQYESAIERGDNDAIGNLVERMDALNAWDYEQRIRQILGQLKIHKFDQPISSLSGGQQKRVALAALLISEPDFIILDEPTNHLDLEIIDWLEDYLTRSNVTLLMVTHDRYFLDRVCNTIFELDNQQIYQYEGNYTYFLEKRQQRLETSDAEAAKARNLLRKEQDWMNRQPQARAGKAQYRIDAYYQLKERAAKRQEERNINLQFSHSRLGNKVVDAYDISKAFDGRGTVIENFSYKFARGEKVGIVGNNGSGKSTLLNMLTGYLAPDSGYIDTGDTVVPGYYRQEGIQVDENKTVLEVISDIAENIYIGDKSMNASAFLRYFLFPNEMHHVRVDKLSGGEKKRLYLLTVLVKNPNFLILDEPTNDLDILTLNVLEEYLVNFGGTVLIVSHDRFFVDKIVDHIFVIEGNGKVQDFPGNYSEWIAYSKLPQKDDSKPKEKEEKKDNKPRNNDQQRPRKLSFAEQRELSQLEIDMPQAEQRKAEIEQKLSSGQVSDPTELSNLSKEYEALTAKLDEMETRWLELQI